MEKGKLPSAHVIKAYRVEELQLHSFLILAMGGSEWLNFTLRPIYSRYQLHRRLGEPLTGVWTFVEEKNVCLHRNLNTGPSST